MCVCVWVCFSIVGDNEDTHVTVGVYLNVIYMLFIRYLDLKPFATSFIWLRG